jgi:hypothetical protein
MPHDGDDEAGTTDDGRPTASAEVADAADEVPLSDLDESLLFPTDPDAARPALDPDDFTDLDDQLLYFHRQEDLRDRYGPVGLGLITAVHFLPVAVGLLAASLPVDTSVLAPSLGLDLYFVTGLVAFFSGVAANLAREYGTRYLLRYALAALLAGSTVYALALLNAAVAPGSYLTAGGTAAGIFPQLNAGVAALSAIGGLLVVARLAYEYRRGDATGAPNAQ